MIRIIIISSILFLVTYCASAQDTIVQKTLISTENYDQLIEEIPFDKTKNALRPKPPKEKKKKEKKKKETDISPQFYDTLELFSIIPLLLLAVIIVFLLFFIFSNVQVDKKIEESTLKHHEIEDIEEVDTLDGYNKALSIGDYRGAIRWRFLNVLQILSEKNIINWKQDKTNRDYGREMRGHKLNVIFNTLVNIFDNVWYGNLDLDRERFNQLDAYFIKFITQENE